MSWLDTFINGRSVIPSGGLPSVEKEEMLRVDRARFSYQDGEEVLSDVSLSVHRGTCTCLMGVNGCGKSTLLDCILGMHHLATGAVLIAGTLVSRLRPTQVARLVAYVPQVHERSFPYMVDHIVLMGRTAYAKGVGAPSLDDQDRVDAALEECGIAHLAHRPYTSLSGGEMQMVLLARALVQETPLILMDEPTAHLDFKNELLFLETIEQLILSRKVAVLMATHTLNQAFHLDAAGVPTQVVLMHQGVIHHEGAPHEVLTQETLRNVFGIEAHVLEQIVPYRTLSSEEMQGGRHE